MWALEYTAEAVRQQETASILGNADAMASIRRGLRDAAAGRIYRRTREGRFVRVRRRK